MKTIFVFLFALFLIGCDNQNPVERDLIRTQTEHCDLTVTINTLKHTYNYNNISWIDYTNRLLIINFENTDGHSIPFCIDSIRTFNVYP